MTLDEIRLRDQFAAAALTGRLANVRGEAFYTGVLGALPAEFYRAVFQDAAQMLVARGTPTLQVSAVYEYSSNTLEPPTGAQLRFDAANPVDVTKVWMPYETDDGFVVKVYLPRLVVGSVFRVEDADDPARFVELVITAPLVDKVEYGELPVRWQANGTALQGNQKIYIYGEMTP